MTNTNKVLIGVFATLLILIAGSLYFFPRCEEPSDMKVLMTQLACAQEVITPDLRVRACQELGREDDCQFSDEDRPAIMELVNREVNACARKRLAEESFCTDTVKDL